MEETYVSKKALEHAFRTRLVPFVKSYGFTKFKAMSLSRVTQDSILQVISIRTNKRGEAGFITDIMVRPLSIPLILPGALPYNPGAPLYHFIPVMEEGAPKPWSHYNTEVELEESLNWTERSLEELALPWLERMRTVEGVLAEYESPTQPNIAWGFDSKTYELAILYLQAGRYEQASRYFQEAISYGHSDAGSPKADFILQKSQEALDLLGQPEAILTYLAEVEKNNRISFKIKVR